jgi:hypothetical protein
LTKSLSHKTDAKTALNDIKTLQRKNKPSKWDQNKTGKINDFGMKHAQKRRFKTEQNEKIHRRYERLDILKAKG